jgi:hypothetical protein
MRLCWRSSALASKPGGTRAGFGKEAIGQPPLKSLHADGLLIQSKLQQLEKLTTQELIDSLQPGQPSSLKVRPDGTMLDGHHRVDILRRRGVAVDSLPREIVYRS